jgi:hypothetical protein
MEFNFIGESDLAYFIPALKVIGAPISIARGREVDCCFSWSSFLRIFILVFIVFLGLISPYSFELGFGVIVVPWLWRYSWGLIILNFDMFLSSMC